jgi:Spy/CpxP family protein refolding chaperone
MKSFFSTLAVIALCSGMAMAQTGPVGGPAEGPTIVTAQAGQVEGFAEDPGPMTVQAGPGQGFMGGPMPPRGGREMFIRRERGPNVFFRARGRGSWWTNPEVAERIGLSDQQKQQLEKINQDSQLKMIDLRADLEKQQVILAPMLKAYHPDEAEVLAQVDKVSQARAALEKARVQTTLASRNVLTEEQWQKLHDTRMTFHRTFGPRRGSHPPGRMRPQPPSKQQAN